jgi:hypothetical protein
MKNLIYCFKGLEEVINDSASSSKRKERNKKFIYKIILKLYIKSIPKPVVDSMKRKRSGHNEGEIGNTSNPARNSSSFPEFGRELKVKK